MDILELNEFHQWENKKGTAKKHDDPLKGFLVTDLVEVFFKKGSYTMHYKSDFADDYKERHNPKSFTPQRLPSRGIASSKKEKKLKDLVPLMPINRRVFWETLPESEKSEDLVSAEQEGELI